MSKKINITVDGVIRQVLAVYGEILKPKLPRALFPFSAGLLQNFNLAYRNSSGPKRVYLPKGCGRSVRRLILARSDYTIKILFSETSLTYATEHLLPPDALKAVDTRKQLLHTSHGCYPARIREARLTPVELLLVKDTMKDSKLQIIAKQLEQISQDFQAVARGNYELRRENEELKQLHSQGYLNFTMQVEGKDFQAFAAIMALGTTAAAAKYLKIPSRTFYDQVNRWKAMSKPYRTMSRLVGCRKATGRKTKLPLGRLLQSGEAEDGAENPTNIAEILATIGDNNHRSQQRDLLRDILEALTDMKGINWQASRDELIQILKEEVAQ